MGMGFRHYHGRQCLLGLCLRDMAAFSQLAETVAGKKSMLELHAILTSRRTSLTSVTFKSRTNRSQAKPLQYLQKF